MRQPPTTRDFTVAVFVVDRGRVLLHRHRKLDRWLPPGGHIEPDELPDDAARREVLEESGVSIRLVGPSPIAVDEPGQPKQLCRPAGIQLATIAPGHEHIDLVYLAEAIELPVALPAACGWFDRTNWSSLDLTEEVEAWCMLAIAEVAAAHP